MANTKWQDATAIHTCLNVAAQGTTLNALTNNSRAISNATGDLDNGTDLDLFGDFELLVDIQVAPSVGAKIAELYLLPSVDDTNFPDGSTSITPQAILLIGVFEARQAITGDLRMVLPGIPLPARKMRFLLINVSGQTFGANDGHFLKVKPYKVQT